MLGVPTDHWAQTDYIHTLEDVFCLWEFPCSLHSSLHHLSNTISHIIVLPHYHVFWCCSSCQTTHSLYPLHVTLVFALSYFRTSHFSTFIFLPTYVIFCCALMSTAWAFVCVVLYAFPAAVILLVSSSECVSLEWEGWTRVLSSECSVSLALRRNTCTSSSLELYLPEHCMYLCHHLHNLTVYLSIVTQDLSIVLLVSV